MYLLLVFLGCQNNVIIDVQIAQYSSEKAALVQGDHAHGIECLHLLSEEHSGVRLAESEQTFELSDGRL